jgi:hypothetical protein
MKKYTLIIAESFHSFIKGDDRKEKHKHEVHALVQKAYEKIGGIRGSGFESPDHMVKHLPMWKIHKHKGKIVAASFYKDKHGRKGVAVASDGSTEGKNALGKMMHGDIHHKRSWSEKSGAALSFTKKQFGGNIKEHAIPFDKVKHLHDEELRRPSHDDPEIVRHPELKDHFYQRKIQGHWHTKVALGTPHNEIKK